MPPTIEPMSKYDLVDNFHLPLSQAAKHFKVSETFLKKVCRMHNIPRWPYRKIRSDIIKMSKPPKSSPMMSYSDRNNKINRLCAKSLADTTSVLQDALSITTSDGEGASNSSAEVGLQAAPGLHPQEGIFPDYSRTQSPPTVMFPVMFPDISDNSGSPQTKDKLTKNDDADDIDISNLDMDIDAIAAFLGDEIHEEDTTPKETSTLTTNTETISSERAWAEQQFAIDDERIYQIQLLLQRIADDCHTIARGHMANDLATRTELTNSIRKKKSETPKQSWIFHTHDPPS